VKSVWKGAQGAPYLGGSLEVQVGSPVGSAASQEEEPHLWHATAPLLLSGYDLFCLSKQVSLSDLDNCFSGLLLTFDLCLANDSCSELYS
jgi:hypothetical protein